ncbi:MAG: TetR/AcrR family transcriptional regulator [Bacteroidia bacterium]|nr:TetR/AcrR family transcriptional regulator [Bacteroidia bacterium]
MGRKSKANVRRQEILNHFYTVIIEEGFEGASIAKIANKMDVNPSLIIHYFKSKDLMVLGLIEYIIETYSSHILPDFSNVSDPQERWEDVVDVISRIKWSNFLDTTVFYSAFTLSLRNEEIKKKFSELYKGVESRLTQEIAIARDANIINVSEPDKVAKLILSLLEGTNYYQNMDDELGNTSGKASESDLRSQLMKKTIEQICNCGKF